jgi:hypothetical protein
MKYAFFSALILTFAASLNAFASENEVFNGICENPLIQTARTELYRDNQGGQNILVDHTFYTDIQYDSQLNGPHLDLAKGIAFPATNGGEAKAYAGPSDIKAGFIVFIKVGNSATVIKDGQIIPLQCSY